MRRSPPVTGRALAGAFVLGACLAGASQIAADQPRDGPPTDRLGSGAPVRQGSIRGAGTPLAEGFEVEEGSWLLGDVLPDIWWNSGMQVDASVAVLLLDAPVGEVLDAYLAQAVARGYTARGDEDRPISPCDSPDPDVVCAVSVSNGDRWVRFEARQGPPVDDRPAQSAMVMTVAPADDVPDGRPLVVALTGRGEVPERWADLPDVGEPFFATKRGSSSFDLVRGTHLLAPPLVRVDHVTWAVFEVTGDPEEVLRAYQDQDHGDDCPIRRSRRRDDLVVTRTCWTPGTSSAFVFERPGAPTLMLLEANPLS